IGVYKNGIGFGNISSRLENNHFLISGSATGGITELNKDHYTVVTSYNLNQNNLTCKGPIKASSESLSHAVIYECSSSVNAVIHVHSMKLWSELLHALPTTNTSVAYGTPDMAIEIKRLFEESDIEKHNTIIMGGHEEGILVFGKSMNEAGDKILELFYDHKKTTDNIK
ncbi:MAG: class II aldolase/adducin family protein, partial [Bacteroidota bacterium]